MKYRSKESHETERKKQHKRTKRAKYYKSPECRQCPVLAFERVAGIGILARKERSKPVAQTIPWYLRYHQGQSGLRYFLLLFLRFTADYNISCNIYQRSGSGQMSASLVCRLLHIQTYIMANHIRHRQVYVCVCVCGGGTAGYVWT